MPQESAPSGLDFLDTKTRNALAKAGFTTAQSLLAHYPARHEDRRTAGAWPTGPSALPLSICGEISDMRLKRFGRQSSVEVTLRPPEHQPLLESITLRWFSMPFIYKQFAAGLVILAYGKLKLNKAGRLIIDHPEHEIVSTEDSGIHMQRIVPVYRAREGVPQKTLRRAIYQLLERQPEIPDILPPASEASPFHRMTRLAAVHSIHFPDSMAAQDLARQYLALEEFFTLQLNVFHRRLQWAQLDGASHCGPGQLMDRWQHTLPFPLTGAQVRSITEIRADLAQPQPMHRMLQGDVGSGKTFVAMAAMLLAVEAGYQAALMAPTQILAEQHFLSFRKWLEPLGLRIGLRTAHRSADSESPGPAAPTPPHIIIGTHALLHEEHFTNLGFIVIDEQHKFGVEQRARLIRQGRAPDVLVMTATPIPRTLTMTVYGDLDVSSLDELPAGRRPITTAVRPEPDRAQVVAFLQEQFTAGRQAYLVFPLVDESEKLDVRAATKEFTTWKNLLPDRALGLVHGRVAADEKERVMREFRAGTLHALVATSVIEVGVDVPNASVMIIFDAERFGLAQLHQLRGRVGRGQHKSYCLLVASGENEDAIDRLRELEKTTDGFAIAEADLKLRGPGDILGTAQSGLPGLRLGDLITDTKLIRTARSLASRILREDPQLTHPDNACYRALLLSPATLSSLG